MRAMEKGQVLELLDSMRETVEKLPDTVTYGRLFLVDDEQGLIISEGVDEAAEAMGKSVETIETREGWEYRQFRVGQLLVCQMVRKGA